MYDNSNSLTHDLLADFRSGASSNNQSGLAGMLEANHSGQSPMHYNMNEREMSAGELSAADDQSLSDGAVSMTSRESAHFTYEMQQFFADVEIVKKHIRTIQAAAANIQTVDQSYGIATTSAQESALSAQSKVIVADASKCAQIAKSMISIMRENNERIRTSPYNRQGEQRIRENLTNTLTRKFVEVMKSYQNSQQLFKANIKKKVRRQVQIVKPDATQEEVDALVNGPLTAGAGNIFQTAILEVSCLVVYLLV